MGYRLVGWFVVVLGCECFFSFFEFFFAGIHVVTRKGKRGGCSESETREPGYEGWVFISDSGPHTMRSFC